MYRRDYKALLLEVFIPVILIVIGLAFSKVNLFFNPAPKTIDQSLFPSKP